MGKLKHFLLIDDSKATNFFNKTIIQKVDCVEEVSVAENGKEALDRLQSGIVPEIIFLDINMPVMNGWEFLSEFQKFDNAYHNSIIVLMLGAQLNDEEQRLAKSIPEIKAYSDKMLTKRMVCDIIDKHFDGINPEACVQENKLVS
ncbi:response regulator [Aquimarina gracilis]|uniref:Response regulator n=1 Tax=Aquimarina gracilis TaxID=874422 RepID=A0ABU5ZUU2_9FLAO|nr:response regulator [Aquimarina gracilis]MEB3345773.1 response regulator [Aquimarina gracilis]